MDPVQLGPVPPHERTQPAFDLFLIFAGANIVATTLVTGAFRAQYIGAVVPLRCGAVGGMCRVSGGVGRTVLH